jgi:hypothetical protein
MVHPITKKELFQVESALIVAIALQFLALRISSEILPDSQYIMIAIELFLALVIGFTANFRHSHLSNLHHLMAVILLALLSAANISALIFVLDSLIINHVAANGGELLTSAIAIFITNIIVFALWYWEVDSPGLTGKRWSKHDKDFQFTQQTIAHEFPGWQPQFGDYLYIAITNGINFAPADANPLTLQAKYLMAAQSMVSVFTLALVVARSVNILGI